MTCSCNNSCSCSNTAIEQAVNDAVADKEAELTELTQRSEQAAVSADASAAEAETFATQASSSAQVASTNATSAAASATQAAQAATGASQSAAAALAVTTSLQSTADQLAATASGLSDKVDTANASAITAENAAAAASVSAAAALEAQTAAGQSASSASVSEVSANANALLAVNSANSAVAAQLDVTTKVATFDANVAAATSTVTQAAADAAASAATATAAVEGIEDKVEAATTAATSAQESADEAKGYVTSLQLGITSYATTADLQAATPTSDQVGVALDTDKLYHFTSSTGNWTDMGVTLTAYIKDITNVDTALNSTAETWVDTQGVTRKTWKGIEVSVLNSNAAMAFASAGELLAFTPATDNVLAQDTETGTMYYWNGTVWTKATYQVNEEINDITNTVAVMLSPLSTVVQTFTASGTFEAEIGDLISINSITPAPSSAGITSVQSLTIQQGSNELFKLKIYPGESYTKGLLNKYYVDATLTGYSINSLTLGSSAVRFRIGGVAALTNPNINPTSRNVYDNSEVFTANTATEQATATTKTIGMHTDGVVQITVPNTEITDAGYTLDAAGVLAFMQATYPTLSIHYRTMVALTEVISGVVSISEEAEVTLVATTGLVFNVDFSRIQESKDTVSAPIRTLSVNALDKADYDNVLYEGHYLVATAPTEGDKLVNIIAADSLTAVTNNYAEIDVAVDGVTVASRYIPGNSAIYRKGTLKSTYSPVTLLDLTDPVIRASNSTMLALTLNAPAGSAFASSSTTPIILDILGKAKPGIYWANGSSDSAIASYNSLTVTPTPTANQLQMIVPIADVTAAGYDATVASSVLEYLKEVMRDSLLLWYTGTFTTVTGLEKYMQVPVPSGILKVTMPIASTSSLLQIRGKHLVREMTMSKYVRKVADLKNDTSLDYTNYPMELKVAFAPGQVASSECLVLKDSEGQEYPCQFAGEMHPNARQLSNFGYHSDGSLGSGSVFFIGSLAAGAQKFMELKAYERPVTSLASKALSYTDANTATLTVGDYIYTFDKANGWNLTSVTDGTQKYNVEASTYVNTLGANGSTLTAHQLLNRASIRIINSGPIFTDVMVLGYLNAANVNGGSLLEGSMEAKVVYRIFESGKIQIRSWLRAVSAIPASVLQGANQRLWFKDAVYSSTPAACAVFNQSALNNKIMMSIMLRANGDIHRDGDNYGPTRPALYLANSPSGVGIRQHGGWSVDTAALSFSRWSIPKNWTWTSEYWVDFNSSTLDPKVALNIAYNRPFGLLDQVSFAQVTRQQIISTLEAQMDGSMEWWYSGDASNYNGGNGTSRTFVYACIVYDLYRYVKHGIGSLETVYNRFVDYCNANWGSFTNIGSYYTSGKVLLQFASRLLLQTYHWMYKVAVEEGNTVIAEALASSIATFAQAIVTAVNATGGSPLNGTSTVSNSNSNATGMRVLALAIMMGKDTSGSFLTAFNTLEDSLTNSTTYSYVTNVIKEGANDVLPIALWLHYQMYAENSYKLACDAIGRSYAFNLDNYVLRAASAAGGFHEIDYCISESRRGGYNTLVFAIHSGVMSKRASMANLAKVVAPMLNTEFGAQPGFPKRIFDYDGTTSSGNAGYEISFSAAIMCDTWFSNYFRLRENP